MARGECTESVADAFGYYVSASGRGLGEDEKELISAESTEEVVGAQPFGDGGDQIADSFVACGVSFCVVDGLEVVDVDERDGERLVAAFDAFELNL